MRYLRYGVFGGLGLVILLGGPVAFSYGLYQLMETGSCGNSSVYVTQRACPEGTGENVLLLVAGIFSVFLGPPIFALRGTLTEGGTKKISIIVTGLWMWAGLFVGGGAAALYSALGPEAEFEGGKGTGIFLAALFIPMGLIPVIGALLAWGSGRYTRKDKDGRAAGLDALKGAGAGARPATPVRPAPPAAPPRAYAMAGQPSPGSGVDPVERLRELADLRDAGVLTQAEFDAAKARVLSDL